MEDESSRCVEVNYRTVQNGLVTALGGAGITLLTIGLENDKPATWITGIVLLLLGVAVGGIERVNNFVGSGSGRETTASVQNENSVV